MALAAGVALDRALGGADPVAWASLASGGLVAAVVTRHDAARRVGLVGGFVALGALLLSLEAGRPLPADHLLRRPSHPHGVMVEGRLRSAPRPVVDGRWLLVLDAELLEGPDGVAPVSGGLRVTLARAPTEVLVPGDRVRLRASVAAPRGFRVPGGRDRAAALARRGVEAVAWLEDPRGLVRLAAGGGRPVAALLARRVAALRSIFDGAAEEDDADGRALLGALALGEGGALPRTLRAAFDATGTSHLLAVSGLHLGIVAALVFLLLRGLLARSTWLLLRMDVPRLCALLTIPAAWGYALLTGGATSTLRAAVMATALLAVRASGRRGDSMSGLGLAALLLLAARPSSLFEPGFQLSFVAAAGVILGAPALLAPFRLQGRGKVFVGAATLLAVSLGASLSTSPIVAWHFHRAAPLGPLANLILVPPVALVLLPLAVALTLIASWPALAAPLASLAIELCGGLAAVARVLAGLPLGSGPLPPPNLAEIMMWYLALALAWAAARRARWAARLLAVCLVAMVVDAAWHVTAPGRSDDLRVDILDVGQGDATLLRLPGGAAVLVDAGGARSGAPDPGELAVSPALLSERVRALDLLVVTHPHRDHCGGVRAVLSTFPVAEIWTSGQPGGDPACSAALDDAASAGVPVRAVAAGHGVEIGRGCLLEVLHPAVPGDDDLGVNDRSLVTRLDCGPSMTVLLTGDIEAPGEGRLLGRTSRQALHAELLKAPHHGARTSSTAALLNAVRPSVTAISVGRGNRFGQPAEEVVRRYLRVGSRVRRTDREGTISLVLSRSTAR